MMRQGRSDDNGRCRWRLTGLGFIMAAMLATTAQGAELVLLLNQDTFTAGETLSLTAIIDPEDVLVDVYIGLLLPSGEPLVLTPEGGLSTTVQSLTPDGLDTAVTAEVLSYTLTGEEPPGPYTWVGVLTGRGTAELVGRVARAEFTVAGEP